MHDLKFDQMLPLVEDILTLSSQEPTSAFLELHAGVNDFDIITDCSTDFSFFLGYRRSEIIGRSAFDLTPLEFHDDMRWASYRSDPERLATLPEGVFFKHWLRRDGSEAPSAMLIAGQISDAIPRRIIKVVPVRELPIRNPPIQPYEFRWLRKQGKAVISV